ncbi:MAG: type VI secretion system tube protein Hcp [Candidatus Hinthialibacter antarcticus]|nr:type VI secretion system tube protein Hcp [Candidatus Hinthialibacter antarcticus]
MLRNRTVLLLLGLAPLFLLTSSTAHGAAYIKFDGVDGECQDANHKGWSDILSVEHLIQHVQIATSGRTLAQHFDLTFTKELDKASPKLAEACLRGNKIKRVLIEFQSNIDNPFIWERIVLDNVLVSRYEIQTSDEIPQESFSLNYEKIHWRYVPINANGSGEAPVTFGWDQIANVPFDPEQAEPTPTPTVNPVEPTPTPVTNPVEPTPTPIVGPIDPTPTPPTQGSVTIGGDLLNLYEDEFRQKAVIVRELNLSQDPPGMSDLFSEQFYSMASLPGGGVITNVKKRNLQGFDNAEIPDDADLLVRITPEGEMLPFAQIKSPDVLLDGEPIQDGESKFLNLSFNGKDEISVLIRVNGKNNRSNSPYAAVVLLKIVGPFDAASVGSFRVY